MIKAPSLANSDISSLKPIDKNKNPEKFKKKKAGATKRGVTAVKQTK